MSVRIMSKVWDSQLGSHTEKLVLLALADNANDEGLCWPSRKTIARKCDLSETAVRSQIKEFESAGLISITETGGGHLSNRYQFDLKKLDEMAEGVTALGGQRRDPVGQQRDPQGATALPAGGNAVATNHKETKIEPSVEPSLTDGFETFWKAYPNRVAKGAAVKAWLKVVQKKIPLAEILSAIENQKDSVLSKTRDGGKYIPHPASWLNAERYLDEIPQSKKPTIENGDTWGNFIPKY